MRPGAGPFGPGPARVSGGWACGAGRDARALLPAGPRRARAGVGARQRPVRGVARRRRRHRAHGGPAPGDGGERWFRAVIDRDRLARAAILHRRAAGLDRWRAGARGPGGCSAPPSPIFSGRPRGLGAMPQRWAALPPPSHADQPAIAGRRQSFGKMALAHHDRRPTVAPAGRSGSPGPSRRQRQR